MTKKLPLDIKQSRKPTRVACEFCHSKHLQCDDSRPCKNCCKRGFQGTCKDAVRKKKASTPKNKKQSNGIKKSKFRKRKLTSSISISSSNSNSNSDPEMDSSKSDNDMKPKKLKDNEVENSIARGIINADSSIPPILTDHQQVVSQSNINLPSLNSTNQLLNLSNSNFPSTSALTVNQSYSDLKSPLLPLSLSVTTLTNLLNPPSDSKPITQPSKTNDSNLINIMSQQKSPVSTSLTPEQQPLEFKAPSSTNKSIATRSYTNSPLHKSITSNNTPNEVVSSNGSIKNFESAIANEEYIQLTDLLNTNPPSPADEFFSHLAPSPTDSEDLCTRPYIEINIEESTMISSYPKNTTPNSFVYNPEHSQIPNTAREIPNDLLQEEGDYTSPLIMRHVIKQPDDIYLTSTVKAYQYPKAYHALIAYLKKRFNKLQLIEIAKCMAKYRPSFISATKNLYENDLIFTERSFQRTLLEYENLISMSPSPTIIWRRTGEIVALTNEFAVITGYSRTSLLSKRTYIVELMDDESTIKYFKSFSELAFGDLNATFLTDCNLRKANDDDYLKCCCVWTIKRDVFDIPMLIVGQFLPVLDK